MVILDHRFLPHIVDAIWDEMDVWGALVAAQSYPAWEERKDRVVQRHIVVWPTCVGGLDLLAKPFGTCTPPADVKKRLRLPRYCVYRSRMPQSSASPGQEGPPGTTPTAESVMADVYANFEVIDWQVSSLYSQLTETLHEHSVRVLQRLRPETVMRVIVRGGPEN